VSINYAAWKFYLDIILIAINAGIGAYVWWSNREKVTNSRFKKIEERVGKVEGTVARMPVCDNHTRMEANDKHINDRLESIDRGLSKIDGRLEGINRMVDLLTQNELSGGKGQ
jgi:hypothetical protein